MAGGPASGAQEVDEEQGHEAKENGHRYIDHPVSGARLGRWSDTRRGRSTGAGAGGADVVALVDAQPLLGRVDDSDQLVPVEQLGGLLGAVLVGVLARLEARPGEERGVGTKAPCVLVRPRVTPVRIDAADNRKATSGAAAGVHRAPDWTGRLGSTLQLRCPDV